MRLSCRIVEVAYMMSTSDRLIEGGFFEGNALIVLDSSNADKFEISPFSP